MNNDIEIEKQPLIKKLTNWNEEPSYSSFHDDYTSALEDHALFIVDLEERRLNLAGGEALDVAEGKSNVRPRLIRKQAEWKYPALEEPFLNTQDMFDIKPRTGEDEKAARQNSILINYQWATKVDKVQVVGDIVRTLVDEGTVIVKTGWESEEEIVEVEKEQPVYASAEESYMMLQRAVEMGQMDPQQAEQILASGQPMQSGTEIVMVEETKLVKNQPTYEVCDNENVIIDPTCRGILADAQFIIHEYETDMNTLKKQEFTTDEEGNESGIYKNLDHVRVDDGDEDELVLSEEGKYETNFKFKDKARKKLTAYEYWGYYDIDGNGETTAIIATWIGKTLIRLEENPFPHKTLPFSLAVYMPVKGRIHGQSDGDLLIENQESIGKMTRAAHDITSTQAIGQEFVNEGFFASPLQKDNYKAGRTVYFKRDMDPRNGIHKQTVEAVPRTVFDMINMQNNDAESLSGTKAFVGGISGEALGTSVGGIRSALDATSKRELSILRRVSNQLFKDIASKTIIMNQAYLDEKEVVRITNGDYIEVNREDLAGQFDLLIDVSTPEKDNDTAEKLNMLMQTNAASMHPEMSKIIYAKIARLWKQPDLAEEMENFQPQPDPAQEEMQRMQMENLMLENKKLQMEIAGLAKNIESEDSKIAERDSRAQENIQADGALKLAKTEKEQALTEKLRSETDQIDMEFLQNESGQKRQEQLDDKEHDRLRKLDEIALGQMNKMKGGKE